MTVAIRRGGGMGLEAAVAALERSSTTLGAEVGNRCQAGIASRNDLVNRTAPGIARSLERFGDRLWSHQGFPRACSRPHRGSPWRWVAALLQTPKAVCILAMFSLTGEPESVDVEADLRETARHINRSTPRPIGNTAILEGAEAHERTLKYKFRFKELGKEEVSSEFKWKQTEFLTEFVCTTPEMKVFVENKVTLKYAYHDKHGKLVIIISIEPRACSRE
jgi:hypothetical protein